MLCHPTFILAGKASTQYILLLKKLLLIHLDTPKKYLKWKQRFPFDMKTISKMEMFSILFRFSFQLIWKLFLEWYPN